MEIAPRSGNLYFCSLRSTFRRTARGVSVDVRISRIGGNTNTIVVNADVVIIGIPIVGFEVDAGVRVCDLARRRDMAVVDIICCRDRIRVEVVRPCPSRRHRNNVISPCAVLTQTKLDGLATAGDCADIRSQVLENTGRTHAELDVVFRSRSIVAAIASDWQVIGTAKERRGINRSNEWYLPSHGVLEKN